MKVEERIEAYLAGQPDRKRDDLRALHQLVTDASPGCRLWFLDGTDEQGKTVTNPSIGYGERLLRQGRGGARTFYRVGVSATSTGISVYVLGLDDKTHLARAYAASIGKAKVTGYCISFRSLADIDTAVLEAAVRDGFADQPSDGERAPTP